MTAPASVDLSIEIKLPRSNQTTKKKHKCTCCGASWDTQKGHFSKSGSPIYQSNDGYVTVCNSCRDKLYYKFVDFFNGNEEKAIERICQMFDIIYERNALVASRQISSDRSRISHYFAKKNLGQTTQYGQTYTDTIRYQYLTKQDDVIESREQAKSEESTISASAIDRWGVGFAESDYKLLDEHYRMLKKNNPNCDNNQEIFIKDLCYTKLLQMKAMRGEGKSDDFEKYTKLYRETFKQAGLKTTENTDSSKDDTLGVTLATISQYTPEEYYLNKKLYSDFDKLGEYFDRFVKRPLRNLMTGSKDRDKEFYVKDDNTEDGDLDE